MTLSWVGVGAVMVGDTRASAVSWPAELRLIGRVQCVGASWATRSIERRGVPGGAGGLGDA